MKTVHEVSKLTGVSIRTLQYYDKIGLLKPSVRTEAGYRLYDDKALERMQQILLFRELEFSLNEIQSILEAPDFDRAKALDQQIELLTIKKERLEGIISFAQEIKEKGEVNMKFEVFDTSKTEEYKARAKDRWGSTKEYTEYEEKAKYRTQQDEKSIASGLMSIFAEFGKLRQDSPESSEAQSLVNKLQNYISKHYYNCSDNVLSSLGKMYAADGEFKTNIDNAGGNGTAQFVHNAIEAYCSNK